MKSFKRSNFFPFKKKYNIKEINSLLGGLAINSNIISDFTIDDISSLSCIKDNSILFLEKLVEFPKNPNILFIISNNRYETNLKNLNYIQVSNISDSYNLILNNIYYHEDNSNFPDDFELQNGSYISKYSNVHESVEIGKNCVIGRGVIIKKNSIIKNNVVIKNCLIGENVIICDNTSIGTTGFGFDFNKRGSNNLNPQIGIVYIDDNAHIGSNCTIDRAKIDTTYIGKNSMIDNLVHIAHNVYLSDNACIAAQSGISGSVIIGKNSTIGGQSGFAGHINIGDNVVVAAKSGVTKNINDNSTVAGFPATDIKEWKRSIIRQKKNGHK